jgi:hypothetical protein
MREMGVDEVIVDIPPNAKTYLAAIEFVAASLLSR